MLGLLGLTTNYTGKLIARCQERPLQLPPDCSAEDRARALQDPRAASTLLDSYEAIGEAAFGPAGRTFITTVLYTELIGTCGLFFILAGDHLAVLTDGAHNANWFMSLSAALMIPSTWLPDLSALSTLGLLGGGATAILTGVIGWEFLSNAEAIDVASTHAAVPETLPLTFGLLAFVFAGHAVFPNIYTSMREPERYDEMLDRTYAVVGAVCLLVGTTGYLLYGDLTNEEVTLNLPDGLLSTLALGAIVVTPFAKFALTLDPVARGVDDALGLDIAGSSAVPARLVRTGLGLGALVLATTCPFFGLVMGLIGSFLTLTVSVIFPSLCYLSIYDGELSPQEKALNIGIVILGGFSAVSGTYSAIIGLEG